MPMGVPPDHRREVADRHARRARGAGELLMLACALQHPGRYARRLTEWLAHAAAWRGHPLRHRQPPCSGRRLHRLAGLRARRAAVREGRRWPPALGLPGRGRGRGRRSISVPMHRWRRLPRPQGPHRRDRRRVPVRPAKALAVVVATTGTNGKTSDRLVDGAGAAPARQALRRDRHAGRRRRATGKACSSPA